MRSDEYINVRIDELPSGRLPFLEWSNNLGDDRAKQKIRTRIARVRLGNFGQTREVGQGVLELKIDYGPGYRVYLGRDGDRTVILLFGGDKQSQHEDVKKARAYWTSYKKEKTRA